MCYFFNSKNIRILPDPGFAALKTKAISSFNIFRQTISCTFISRNDSKRNFCFLSSYTKRNSELLSLPQYMVQDEIPNVFCSAKQKELRRKNRHFCLFRVPRNNFLVGKCQPQIDRNGSEKAYSAIVKSLVKSFIKHLQYTRDPFRYDDPQCRRWYSGFSVEFHCCIFLATRGSPYSSSCLLPGLRVEGEALLRH